MRTYHALASAVLLIVLAACGGGTSAPPQSKAVVISSPTANAELVTGSVVTVEGTAAEDAQVSVSMGAAAVTAELYAVTSGRRAWRATMTAPVIGDHTITATATSPEHGTSEASVSVKVVGVQPYGAWAGVYHIDRRPNGGELTEGGTMLVWYGSKWFRMYFPAIPGDVEGTTDGWDLVDNVGFRIVGTYYPAGAPGRSGHSLDEPQVYYRGVLLNGDIIEATLDPD